jgi:glycosyltransferase involved in cell wall biosynthesis
VKVAFFGAFDPGYPRTAVLEEGLRERGVETVRIGVPPRTRAIARELRLVARWASRARGLRALIVPSFGHRDVPLASLLGRQSGVPVLFDPLVSRWDTQVMDLGRVRRGSLAESRLRLSDRSALRLADLVLCDTWEQGDFYSTRYGVPRRRLARIPVGADGDTFRAGGARTPRPGAGPAEIVYVGGYLPLHGMEAILDAATLLEDHHGTRLARFTLIGSGMMRPYVEREVAARGLATVRLLPRIPYAEAIRRMAEADIALGVFGTTEKAGRVVPHKVWQAMALGLPVVTRRSAAISEFFRDGSQLRCVPAGDGASLARVLEELAADADARARLGAAGRVAATREGSPGRIGALLLEAVERALEQTAPRPGGRRT